MTFLDEDDFDDIVCCDDNFQHLAETVRASVAHFRDRWGASIRLADRVGAVAAQHLQPVIILKLVSFKSGSVSKSVRLLAHRSVPAHRQFIG